MYYIDHLIRHFVLVSYAGFPMGFIQAASLCERKAYMCLVLTGKQSRQGHLQQKKILYMPSPHKYIH